VYLTPVDDHNRKAQYTWDMIRINTNHPNRISYEAIQNGKIEGLEGYDHVSGR